MTYINNTKFTWTSTSSTTYNTTGGVLTLATIERLLGAALTNKEMLIEELKQTRIGKVLYG